MEEKMNIVSWVSLVFLFVWWTVSVMALMCYHYRHRGRLKVHEFHYQGYRFFLMTTKGGTYNGEFSVERYDRNDRLVISIDRKLSTHERQCILEGKLNDYLKKKPLPWFFIAKVGSAASSTVLALIAIVFWLISQYADLTAIAATEISVVAGTSTLQASTAAAQMEPTVTVQPDMLSEPTVVIVESLTPYVPYLGMPQLALNPRNKSEVAYIVANAEASLWLNTSAKPIASGDDVDPLSPVSWAKSGDMILWSRIVEGNRHQVCLWIRNQGSACMPLRDHVQTQKNPQGDARNGVVVEEVSKDGKSNLVFWQPVVGGDPNDVPLPIRFMDNASSPKLSNDGGKVIFVNLNNNQEISYVWVRVYSRPVQGDRYGYPQLSTNIVYFSEEEKNLHSYEWTTDGGVSYTYHEAASEFKISYGWSGTEVLYQLPLDPAVSYPRKLAFAGFDQSASLSPNVRFLAFVAQDGTPYVLNLKNGQLSVVGDPDQQMTDPTWVNNDLLYWRADDPAAPNTIMYIKTSRDSQLGRFEP